MNKRFFIYSLFVLILINSAYSREIVESQSCVVKGAYETSRDVRTCVDIDYNHQSCTTKTVITQHPAVSEIKSESITVPDDPGTIEDIESAADDKTEPPSEESKAATETDDAGGVANEEVGGAVIDDGSVLTKGQEDASQDKTVVETGEEGSAGPAEKVGDPVIMSTGDFVSTSVDVSMLSIGEDYGLTRKYNSRYFNKSYTLGYGWSSSFDTAVIRGRDRFSSQLLQNIDNQISTAEQSHADMINKYDYWINGGAGNIGLDAAISSVNILKGKCGITYNAYNGAVNGSTASRYPALANKIRNQRDRIGASIDQLQTFENNLKNRKNSLTTGSINYISSNPDINLFQNKSFVESISILRTYIDNTLSSRKATAADELALTNTNSSLNAKHKNATDYQFSGNRTVTFIDRDGVPHLFEIDEPPVYDSLVKLGSGETNYYPSGSSCTPVKPTTFSLSLSSDGEYEVVYPGGVQHKYSHEGILVSIENENGQGLYIDNNSLGKPVVLHSGDREWEIDWNGSGLIEKITDPDNKTVEYAYTSGRLSSVNDLSGDIVQYEYKDDLIHKIIKPDNSRRIYNFTFNTEVNRFVMDNNQDEENADSFDPLNPLMRKPGGGKILGTEYFEYNFADKETIYTSPSGVVTKYYYDQLYRTTRIDYADGSYEEKEYDDRNNLTRNRDVNGYVWEYEYNSLKQLTSVKKNSNLVQGTTYNSDGFVTSSVTYQDGLAISSIYTLDRKGNILEERRENFRFSGSVDIRRYTYTPQGFLEDFTDATGHRVTFSYDSNGFLIERKESVNVMINSGSSTLHQLTESYTRDHNGNPIMFKLTEDSDLIRHWTYSWDNEGRLISLYDELSDEYLEKRVYSNRKDLVQREQPGGIWKYEYNSIHKLMSVENPNGELVQYQYNSGGELIGKSILRDANIPTDIWGSWEYSYDTAGRLVRNQQIETGIVKDYQYYSGGRLARERVFDQSNPSLITQSLEYQYNSMPPSLPSGARIPSHFESVKITEDNRFSKWSFIDSDSNLVSGELSAGGRFTGYIYNGWGSLKGVSGPYDLNRTFDPEGRITQENYNDIVTSYELDELGRRVRIKDESGNSLQINTYTALDQPSLRIDGEGNSEQWSYDHRGRLITHTMPDGARESWSYSGEDKRVYTGFRNEQWVYDLDALSRPIKITDPYGAEQLKKYSPLGNIEEFTDETDRTTTSEYDPAGRLLSEINPAGSRREYRYDPSGRLIRDTDSEGIETQWDYSFQNRSGDTYRSIEKTISGDPITTQFLDGDNLLSYEFLPEGSPYSWEYNDSKELITETTRQGYEQSYEYTNHRLSRKTTFNGDDIRYAYDNRGRLSSQLNGFYVSKSFEYDRNGRMISAVNDDSQLSWEWNNRGLMSRQEDSLIETAVNYHYDSSGNRSAASWDDGDTMAWRWGSRNELLSITGFDDDMMSFGYDAAGRKTQQDFPGITVQKWEYSQAGFTEADMLFQQNNLKDILLEARAFSYDEAGRKLSEVNHLGESIVYHYDDHGRLIEALYPESDEIKEVRFEEYRQVGKYSDFGDWSNYQSSLDTIVPSYRTLSNEDKLKLENAWEILPDRGKSNLNTSQKYWYDRYSYTASGSRQDLQTPWGNLENEYNSDDPTQISNKEILEYSYDHAGNLINESNPEGESLYSYNEENRVEGFEKTNEKNIVVGYDYDALGRRNSRSRVESGEGLQNGIKETWSYDGRGFNPLERQIQKADFNIKKPELTANGSRTRVLSPGNTSQSGRSETLLKQKYVSTGRSVSGVYSLTDRALESNRDGSIRSSSRTGDVSINYLQLDSQGSVRSLINPDGEQSGHITYDAFGSVLSGKVDEQIPFGYNGKVMDGDTGQYNYGYRDYVPSSGRFATIDPIKDGSDWYVYCGNDPVNFVDFYGLETGGESDVEAARRMEAIANLPGEGVPVYSRDDGVVFRSGWQDPNNHDEGMGWRTSVNTEDGYYNQDGHLDPKSTLPPGTRVNDGDPIGRMADPSNGHTTGPHDHVDRRKFGGGSDNDVDPGTDSPFGGPSRITSDYNANQPGLRDDKDPHPGVDHVPEGYVPKNQRDEVYGIRRDGSGNVSGL
jgi:RHS repeat-associated protein